MPTDTTNASPAAAVDDQSTRGIRTVKELRAQLQVAMLIELTTIPPYLTALYSIMDGTNAQAAEVIRSVVMEEMLHLTLAANLLNAVGGSPRIACKEIVPFYRSPGIHLPHSGQHILVGIEPFGRASIRTFMQIEQSSVSTAPRDEGYESIGQFYAAIRDSFRNTVRCLGAAKVFVGDASRQVTGPLYYGGGGEAVAVTDLFSAEKAIDEIVTEGEGSEHGTISDGDDSHGQPFEPSHYGRFREIYEEQRFLLKDTADTGPTGARLPVDWHTVWPIKANPSRADWPEGSPVRARLDAFALAYSDLLRQLEAAFNGSPALLASAVPIMHRLKDVAQELMRTPSGHGKTTVGPAWEYEEGTHGSMPRRALP